MKTRALFITVVGLALFSAGIAFANDTASPSAAKKPDEQITQAITAHQPAAVNGAPSHADDRLKIMQPHNAPLALPAKSNLPVNAGQMRGVAVLGGAAAAGAHKSGVINGTEMRRSP